MARTLEDDKLLTPAEVAALFRVQPQTVARWARSGVLKSARTGGRHRRYWESDVKRLLALGPPRGLPGGLPEDVPQQTRMDEDLPAALR